MRILALDPGITTGYVLAECDREKLFRIVDMGHFLAPEKVYQYIHSRPIGYVVYEGFARGNSVVDTQIKTIELCGGIKAACYLECIPYKMQYPAKRTGYIPAAKYLVKQSGHTCEEMHHAIDAIAHLLCYCEESHLFWNKQTLLKEVFK